MGQTGPAGLRQPDLTLWFDLAPELAAQRRAAARDADRLERESATFFERVRQAYADRARVAAARFARIEADAPRELVWQQVQRALLAQPWCPGPAATR